MSRIYSKNKWKGKEKTRELKHLRKLSTLQRASEKAARTPEKITIKPEFYGTKIMLVPKKWAADRYDGLEEAVKVGTENLVFSGHELRKCNLKTHYILKYDWAGSEKPCIYFDNKNYYVKGHLQYCTISEHEFNKLSEDAKKYFIKSRNYSAWEPKPVWQYDLNPRMVYRSMLKEVFVDIYVVSKVIPKVDDLSLVDEIERHVTGKYGGWHHYWNKELGQTLWWGARANKRQDARSKKRKATIAWKKDVERELLEAAASSIIDGSGISNSEDTFSCLEDIT